MNFGLKVGMVGTVKFEARIGELVENLPDLAVLAFGQVIEERRGAHCKGNAFLRDLPRHLLGLENVLQHCRGTQHYRHDQPVHEAELVSHRRGHMNDVLGSEMQALRKRSMDHFAGLDVSVKETSVCIVDDLGKIVREVKVSSEPEALLAVLKGPAYRFKRIGLEAGPLSQWLFSALAEAGLPVVCVETRHMQAVLKAQINKTENGAVTTTRPATWFDAPRSIHRGRRRWRSHPLSEHRRLPAKCQLLRGGDGVIGQLPFASGSNDFSVGVNDAYLHAGKRTAVRLSTVRSLVAVGSNGRRVCR